MLTLVSTIIIIQFENNLFGTRITDVFNSEKKEESFIFKKIQPEDRKFNFCFDKYSKST